MTTTNDLAAVAVLIERLLNPAGWMSGDDSSPIEAAGVLKAQAARIRELEAEREQLRTAADVAELGFALLGLYDVTDGWGEPQHRDELGCKPSMTCGDVYMAVDAQRHLRSVLDALPPLPETSEKGEGDV